MPGAKRDQADIVAKLREIEKLRASGLTMVQAVRAVGVTESEYRRWRTEFGGLLRTLLSGTE